MAFFHIRIGKAERAHDLITYTHTYSDTNKTISFTNQLKATKKKSIRLATTIQYTHRIAEANGPNEIQLHTITTKKK